MKYDFYLKRQRLTLEGLIEVKKINNYSELLEYFKSISIKPPAEQDVEHLFKREVANVEERPVVESDSKKKRLSSQKSKKPKTDDSTSTGRSRSKQPVRKSPPKRQRKRNSDKVESIQPASGSEDTK
jgi:hypothetical protein